ncbi:response regulator [Herbaspirillum sp. RU 5E]|mgnify:FL=1|uniref:Response regulator n=1 Tax=Herbaspirillum aquaticum TaxID=568783 RepID=A0A225SZP7_9BURK|nr:MULTISPECIES: response regulator [Herbaspirillum]MBW9332267.1 response regulator [Herbaspirillum sp. RU 5E]MRT31612.1 response regulator [Herbaspirillum sp. CAH-3]OWY36819.1 response regulator [Herbaspirillum aquaticum]
MSRPSILMVDPSPESVELARFSLWRSKLECDFGWFEDAERAMESIFSPQALQHPDTLPCLILLEPRLPRMEGLDLLHMLRSQPHTRALPVIMFATSYDETDAARSREAGANDYLVKPVDAREFMQLVNQTVQRWLPVASPQD